jgi:hypothetical protein
MKTEFLLLLTGLTVVLTPNTSTSAPTVPTLQERVQAVREHLTLHITDDCAPSVTSTLATSTPNDVLYAWLNWGNWYYGGVWNNFNQWGKF